ncbi:hypothetical protein L3X38_012940 [Prunus dulcis]|uniref:Fungal lipase-type domain-containing protein n=1 Tax=Prunus dulcis TaxID=3755 RepID=A0AAD4WKA0_PRUDU|nr:hypothetical protein L3X38_012940 [Prunus dulcis]
MRLSIKPVTTPNPSTLIVPTQKFKTIISCCCTLTQSPTSSTPNQATFTQNLPNWEQLLNPVSLSSLTLTQPITPITTTTSVTATKQPIRKIWEEYQGVKNWEGLLDPLDDNLRGEILRYGQFVDAAYKAFDFDPDSPSYATCKYPKSSLFENCELPATGYRLTKNLRATSGIQLPRWIEKAPSWVATQSSWIGYVAVCQDKNEITRLGRRDVVISFRGTATCLEWLENLRATLTHLPSRTNNNSCLNECEPMVESGFLSLYTSGTHLMPSLQQMVREEIARLLQSYGDEPLSLTITGHSLGAALATLAAYDIKTTFNRSPLVTVMSFGGPRVGNRSFRRHLEKKGAKVLRIVNSDDVITKVPGFVIDENERHHVACDRGAHKRVEIQNWLQKKVEDTQWVYAEVGKELRLSSKDSPYVNGTNVSTCHELSTYLHLVDNFVSRKCPFKATAKRLLGRHW